MLASVGLYSSLGRIGGQRAVEATRQNGSSIASLRRLQAEFEAEWGGVEERRRCSKVGTRVVIMRCRAQG